MGAFCLYCGRGRERDRDRDTDDEARRRVRGMVVILKNGDELYMVCSHARNLARIVPPTCQKIGALREPIVLGVTHNSALGAGGVTNSKVQSVVFASW